MEKNKIYIKIFSVILIIIWIIMVYLFSSQNKEESLNTSKGTVEKIIITLMDKTKISQEKKQEIVERVNPIVRKIAHYSEYTLGGILIINFIRLYKIKESRAIFYSIIIGVGYAILDEIHQLFVPGRTAKIIDVFIDSLGVATGVIAFVIVMKCVTKIKNKVNEGEV